MNDHRLSSAKTEAKYLLSEMGSGFVPAGVRREVKRDYNRAVRRAGRAAVREGRDA